MLNPNSRQDHVDAVSPIGMRAWEMSMYKSHFCTITTIYAPLTFL